MHQDLRKALALAALAAVVGASTGCATQAGVTAEDMSALQTRVDKLERQVNTTAHDADIAKQTANKASDQANLALDTANSAVSCCDANSRKLNRMFHDQQTK